MKPALFNVLCEIKEKTGEFFFFIGGSVSGLCCWGKLVCCCTNMWLWLFSKAMRDNVYFFYVWRSVGFLDPWLNSFSCRGRSEGFSVYVWVKIRKKDVWILLTWQQIKRSMAHVMKVCEYSLRAVADCCFSREEIKQKYPILLYLRTLKLSVQLLREPCHFVCCLVSSQPSEMATDKHKDWGARRRYCCL